MVMAFLVYFDLDKKCARTVNFILLVPIKRSLRKIRAFIYLFYFLTRISKTGKKEHAMPKVCKYIQNILLYVKSWNPILFM